MLGRSTITDHAIAEHQAVTPLKFIANHLKSDSHCPNNFFLFASMNAL